MKSFGAGAQRQVARSPRQRATRLAGRVLTGLLVSSLVVGVAAQLVRDRTLWLAQLMYLPLWPLALLAITRDAVARGRALPLRWSLLTCGVVAGGFGVSLLWSPARAPDGHAAQAAATVVQWNMQWGGRGQPALRAMLSQVASYAPDVVCLSESPNDTQLAEALGAASARWHIASVEHAPTSLYWYRLTVMSRTPVVVRREWTLGTGHAALFEVAHEPRTLSILMVDLQSNPKLPRSPSLREVSRIIDTLAASGAAPDLVLGDFNTPGRFVGFDALSAAGEGYRRAALSSGQWRGTWPGRMPLSLFDIDHIWVRQGLGIATSALFASRRTDHRGQVAVLRLP